ncbi:MAG: alpha/beta hydrolase [Candidatus Acidiferrum sp.]
MFTPFFNADAEPAVRGFLHLPTKANGNAMVLAHGAGGDCRTKLLVEVASALVDAGFAVLRIDLPFRQERPHGPPPRGSGQRDRDGLRRAAVLMREKINGRVFLGGHSYGGRQASILAAEPEMADGLLEGLLLLSYPLHPPRKALELRTQHFPRITTAACFVHGTRDPFGTIEEMKGALELIPTAHKLVEVEGAGHDLLGKKNGSELHGRWVKEFQALVKISA